MTDRQSGRTSRLMANAPQGATYVVPVAGTLSYYRHLAAHLGRHDLKFQGPGFLSKQGQPYRGHDPATVVVDHATWEAVSQADRIAAANWWLAGGGR
jgi:hypothetical protein